MNKNSTELQGLSSSSFIHDRLSVYNLQQDYSHQNESLDQAIVERGVRYKDAIHIVVPTGEYWLFDYGVVVFWAVEEDERKALINRLCRNENTPSDVIEDHYRFIVSEELKVNKDTVYLPNDNALTRLAISHGLAQSIKLVEYEHKAQSTISDYSHLPEALANTGKIALNRREIAKIRGRLFSTKSDIILHYGLLDTPEFFWEYPEHENNYNAVVRYLEIHQRVDLLSKKLATIHELFDMLADEQKHQHSSILEWIIIWLIAIEVVIYVGEKLESLF
ncbi:RMD1 family protein [Psychrosphaera sp.]|nr:RMD1 family protein [Psychrosphaera sp.]